MLHMTPFILSSTAFVFILDSVMGSFLNVCIYRVPVGLSIVSPRSRAARSESCGDAEREAG
jgi:leader peptidase (prepilin peptidase)/N-methyltransferase